MVVNVIKNMCYESHTTKPKARLSKPGWLQTHNKQKDILLTTNSKTILIGDSIIKNLKYYQNIWHHHFGKDYINCGIGGDQIQNVFWRVEDYALPTSINCAILLFGTNNLHKDIPIDIVNGIVSIGKKIKERYDHISVFISGILPRDSPSSNARNKIEYVNYHLKKCCEDTGIFYIDISEDWTTKTGELRRELFFS